MRINTSYADGFTSRLLRWTLDVDRGNASLHADWFQNPSPVRTAFRLDDGPVRAALPRLALAARSLEAAAAGRGVCDDAGLRTLTVEDGETSVRIRDDHNATVGAAVKRHPELKAFREVWRLLEKAVAPHLPFDLRR